MTDTDLTRRIEAIIRASAQEDHAGYWEAHVPSVARVIASLIGEREASTVCGEPDGFWMIYFYEAGLPPEIFSGDGAEVAARMRFEQVSIGYNCRLLAPVGALVSPTPEVVRMARQQGYDDGVAAAAASARREALEEVARSLTSAAAALYHDADQAAACGDDEGQAKALLCARMMDKQAAAIRSLAAKEAPNDQ